MYRRQSDRRDERGRDEDGELRPAAEPRRGGAVYRFVGSPRSRSDRPAPRSPPPARFGSVETSSRWRADDADDAPRRPFNPANWYLFFAPVRNSPRNSSARNSARNSALRNSARNSL